MKTQAKRESFEKGETVYVVTRINDSLTKRRSAKVLGVVRGACNLQVNGERVPRLVRFDQIEKEEVAHTKMEPRKGVPPTSMAPLALVPPPPPEVPEVEEVLEEQVELPSQVEPRNTALMTWLEMGQSLIADLELDIAILQDEEAAIHEEGEFIAAQIAELQQKLEDIPRRLAELPARKAAAKAQLDLLKKKLEA